MEQDVKILIIPDVHGRDFWREPVKKVLEESDAPIIFLGDYVDPYPYEWENVMDGDSKIDYKAHAVDILEEIIQLKKDNPNRITLLIGNHDGGYAIGPDICTSRRDYRNATRIEKDFDANIDLFQLADEITINGKHIIFSHAGIGKRYAEIVFGKDVVTEDNVVSLFNNAWESQNFEILDTLKIYDIYRGWGGFDYGSLIWADAREWGNNEGVGQEGFGYMVFGHTQLEEKPYISDKFADLDVRKAFYINSEGEIKEF